MFNSLRKVIKKSLGEGQNFLWCKIQSPGIVSIFFICLIICSSIHLNAQLNVRSWQAFGQVWVVWEKENDQAKRYNIYKNDALSNRVEEWTLVGSLFPEHTIPYPIQIHLTNASQTWLIPDGNGNQYPLASNEGLFVETIRNSEENYYAVLACTVTECPDLFKPEHLSEKMQISFDQNVLVQPHLQLSLDIADQQKLFVYSFWSEGRADHFNQLIDFPVMGNQYTNGWPHYFAVWTGREVDTSKPSPAVNWLHGGSGNFSQYLPGKRPEINIDTEEAIVIAHHDDFYRHHLGNKVLDESNSWWFGWAKNHDPFDVQHDGPDPGDTLINFTQRRIKWVNDWLIRQNLIDDDRIAIQGYSVGSAGAFAMIISYPSFFSSGSLFNCGHQAPDEASFGSLLLGSDSQNFPTNLRDPSGNVLHINDLYSFEVMTSFEDLPLIRSWHGKNDINPTMGWTPKLLQKIRYADSLGLGYQFFWDERAHPIQDIMTHWSNGSQDEDQTAKDDSKYQEKYRNNISYPVFFNYGQYIIHQNNPGNGQTGTGQGNGDDWGTWGGYHEFDPVSVIDEPGNWVCSFYLSGINDRSIDRYAGTDDCVLADFTIRRLQQFTLAPLEPFDWFLENNSGDVVASGSALADQEGQPVIKGVEACRDPDRYTIKLKRNTNNGCDILQELEPKPGNFCQKMIIDGEERFFLTMVPEGYNQNSPHGLLFSFHGGGGNFTNFAFGHINPNGGGREEFHALSTQEKMILVYPQALIHPEIQATSWNTFEYDNQSGTYADDFEFVERLIQHHNNVLNIDPRRIYATGYSKGGDFAQLIGRKLSCFFAGVASVGSSSGVTHELGSPTIEFYPKGENPIPVLMIKGDEDFKRPWIGGMNNNNNLVPSGLEDLDQWILNNDCNPDATQEIVVNPDSSYLYFNEDCKEGSQVQLLRGFYLEHVWPDADDHMGINANQEFISFLKDLRNENSCLISHTNGPDHLENITLHPNPVTNQLTIDFEDYILNSVSIIDMTGNIVKTEEHLGLSANPSTILVDVSDLSSGLYILNLALMDRIVLMKKFIKIDP